MTLNPLCTLLTQNKLDGDNYVDRKCNLDIIWLINTNRYSLLHVLRHPLKSPPMNNSWNMKDGSNLMRWLNITYLAL